MIREYQTIAEANILEAWQTHQRVMFQLATRMGKTQIVTDIIKHLLTSGKRIIFIAHREELITQAWNTFYRHQIFAGIIKAGTKPNYTLPVQIGSIQTMIRRSELPSTDYIIYDEAHHSLEDNSHGKIIDRYPSAMVLGVTATPYRLGGRGFTKLYSHLIESLQTCDGIEQGYLVPIRYYVASNPDMSRAKLSKGDYKDEDSVKAMELAPLVESYLEHCHGLCGICFAVNVQHSIKIAQQYIEAGIKAEHVDANTDMEVRREIFGRLRARTTNIVINVGIATEGLDIPNLDFIQLARPTKSLALFLQMNRAGGIDNEIIKEATTDEHRRYLIACSSKPYCIILDNAGLWREHGLPDQRVDWRRHFVGHKRPKKKIEEMIEIIEFVAEDETGKQIRTKIPKEIEGMKLIEITKHERERVANLDSLREFDRLYSMFKRLPKINKPGYKAFFEYRDYCAKHSMLMNDEVWAHLRERLSEWVRPIVQRMNEDMDRKIEHIQRTYNEDELGEFTLRLKERYNHEHDELMRLTVPSGFLRKEKEKYQASLTPQHAEV